MERIGESLNETFEEVLNAIKDYYKELANVFMDFQEIHSLQQETLIPEVESQGMNEQDMETSWDKAEEEDQGTQGKKINDFGEGGKVEVQSDNMRGKQKEQKVREDAENVDCTRGKKKGRGKKRKRGKKEGAQYLEKGRGGSEMRENMEVMKQRREKKERNKMRSFKRTRKKKLERWLSRGWKIKIGEIK